MNLLIDNTALHAAGRCLRKAAKADADLDGLLQFASQLVLCDKISVSAFETAGVTASSMEVGNHLVDLGFSDAPLEFIEVEIGEFKKCCSDAAERLAVDIGFSLAEGFSTKSDLEVSVPNLTQSEHETFFEIHASLLSGLSDERRQTIRDTAFEGGDNRTQMFMLAVSEQLWRSVRAIVGARDWTMDETYRLIIYLRYYLNQELALVNGASYCPAVSRGRLVKSRSDYLLSRIEGVVSAAAVELGGRATAHPSIVEALAIRSKGEHRGLVEEIQRTRIAAAPLREYLRKQHVSPEGVDGDCLDLRERNETIVELKRRLRQDLGILKRPRLSDAFEVQFLGLVPLPNILKIADWASFKLGRKRVTVLSEFALTLSYAGAGPHAFEKLRRASLHHGA